MENTRIFFVILLVCYIVSFGQCVYYEECDAVGTSTGSLVPSSESCSKFIYCDGENSFVGDCPPDNYFRPSNRTCVEMDDESGCDILNVTSILSSHTTSQTEFELTSTTTPTNTASFVTPPELTAKPTTPTTTTTNYNPRSTKKSSTLTATATSSPTTTTTLSNGNNPSGCPPTDDPLNIVFLANPQSCSDYFVCYHGQPFVMHCANLLHFDVRNGRCDYPEKSKCVANRPNPRECQPHVIDLYPYPDNCQYFYYCYNGFMKLQQCPFFFGWDVEQRKCLPMHDTKCYQKKN